MDRRLRHIFLSGLLAAIWILTPLLSVVHIALEAHTYCAEHGVLEEGRTNHTNELGETDSDLSPAFHATQERPENESHSGCAFNDLATHDITPHVIEVKVTLVPTSVLVSEITYKKSASPIARLFRTAPKTSPPHTV